MQYHPSRYKRLLETLTLNKYTIIPRVITKFITSQAWSLLAGENVMNFNPQLRLIA